MGLIANVAPVEIGNPFERVFKLIDLAQQEARQETLDADRLCLHLDHAQRELRKLQRHFPMAAAFEIYS